MTFAEFTSDYSVWLTYMALLTMAVFGLFIWLRFWRHIRWSFGAMMIIYTVLAVSSFFTTREARKKEIDYFERSLNGYAPMFAKIAEGVGIEQINLKTNQNNPTYLKLVSLFKDWTNTNLNIADVYTLAQDSSGRWHYLVDAETDYDHNGLFEGEREQRTDIGELYTGKIDQVEQSRAGHVVFDAEPETDRWGIWVSSMAPVRNKKGEIVGVLGVDFPAQELAAKIDFESKRALGLNAIRGLILMALAAAVLISRDWSSKFKASLKAFPDQLFLVGSNGVYQAAFSSRPEIMSLRPEKILGKSIYEALPKELADRFTNIIYSVLKSQQGQTVEYDLLVDNKVHHFESRFEAESSERVLIVSRDTSDLYDAKVQAAESQQRSLGSAKLAALGEMAAGIAHEVNNPLAIISGKAYALKRRLSQERFTEGSRVFDDLNKIEETTGRISKIIQGLRSFSRDADNDPLTLISANTLVDQTLALCKSRFAGQGVDLRVLRATGDFLFLGQDVPLSQVLLNLLNNSFDAVGALQEKWVEFKISESNSMIEFRITDSGFGIEQLTQARMFNPFFTTKEVGKGTGLGLSISLGIAAKHKGSLTYEPQEGHTSFVLRIPFERQKNKKA